MKKIINKLNRFFLKRSYPMQVLLFLLSSYVALVFFIPILLVMLATGINTEGGPEVSTDKVIELMVIAPILETLVYQYLIIRLFMYFAKSRKYYPCAILISAIAFGLGHTYNPAYIFFAFFIGLVLAYMYYFYSKEPLKAFWTVVLVHGIRNGISIVLQEFVNL
ncbi:MAG: CPBP family intramembrane metalloprotease [Taibaiella sp.]|nr:CPBP family intramembrane metalloprotease [Taibaiella sp.]